jgi:hypothetical protein
MYLRHLWVRRDAEGVVYSSPASTRAPELRGTVTIGQVNPRVSEPHVKLQTATLSLSRARILNVRTLHSHALEAEVDVGVKPPTRGLFGHASTDCSEMNHSFNGFAAIIADGSRKSITDNNLRDVKQSGGHEQSLETVQSLSAP